MELNERPLHPLFAAEAPPFPLFAPGAAAAIRAAMDRHAVLVLRGQALTDEAQVAFSRQFGPLELPPSLNVRTAAQVRRVGEGIFDVSNLDASGAIEPPTSPRRRFGKADQMFHTDSSFHALPTSWSLLSARIVPPQGGETEFVDLRAAWDALPAELKAAAEGRSAWHSIWHSRAKAGFDLPEQTVQDRLPPVLQPLVRLAADGRRTLYLGSHAMRIEGMEAAESDAVLDALHDFATQDRFVYRHHWQPDDLLIWDNRCTLHRATPFDDLNEKRDMRRTTIQESGIETSAVAA